MDPEALAFEREQRRWFAAKRREWLRLCDLCLTECLMSRIISDGLYAAMCATQQRQTNDLLWTPETDPWLVKHRKEFDLQIAAEYAVIWQKYRTQFLNYITNNAP